MGLELFHPVEDRPDGLAEFQIGRVDHRLLLLGIETEFRRYQFKNMDAIQVPAV